MTDIDAILPAKKSFTNEYAHKKPYSDYINLVGISRIDGKPCIRVGLRAELPPNLSIPTVYQGFPVTVEVIGEIRACNQKTP